MAVEVADNPERERFEATDGGSLAGFIQYANRPGLIALIHTEVEPAYEGKGVGSELARAALDSARERDLAVLPFCPFVNGYISRHPEYTDLVPEGNRPAFGL